MTYATSHLRRPAGFRATGPALRRGLIQDVLIRLFDGLLTLQERASQRHHLSGLDDRTLHDVGLSRADLDAETSKPFWRA